ncbi:MAG: tetratricopeptide repeat protein [Gracilibacteraceae bacterium]|jgi:tetratricopeptide (TPR) repeat protein|nr:tetratricopeptide repeat protein [Gracilibacteraceae bacterium]
MYCVMVGDIVDSKKIDPQQRNKLEQALLKSFSRINTLYQDDIFVRFSTVRGDAFEGVLTSSCFAPQIALEIIEALHPHIIRISIVVGTLTSVGDTADVNIIDGPAFHEANDMLSKMKKRGGDGWLRVAIQAPCDAQPLLDSSMALLSALTRSWTDRQRQLVWAMDHYAGQQKILAQKFAISPAAISKQLKAADYTTYKQTRKALEQFFYSLDLKIEESELQSFTSLLNLAKDKKNQSEYPSALILYMRALKRAEIELGDGHPHLASIHHKLADIHETLEKYDKAEETLNHALHILSSQPRGHLEKARVINALARIKIFTAQYQAADECFAEALSICSYNLGLGHPVAAEIYNSLALMYIKRGEYTDALQSFAHVLTIYEKILGADHPRTAEACGQVADVYVIMQDWEKASVFGRKALRIYESRCGSRHPQTAQAAGRMSKILAFKQVGDETGVVSISL